LRVSLQPPSSSRLFPCTTLFRSAFKSDGAARLAHAHVHMQSARGAGLGDLLNRRPGELIGPQQALAQVGGGAVVGEGDRHGYDRSEEHTSELQSRENLVCRLLLA